MADENVDGRIVDGLRGLGHDVAWIRVDHPKAKDLRVAQIARETERVLITFDKGFTSPEIAATLPGLILLRFPPMQASLIAALTLRAIGARTDWDEHIATISAKQIRMRRLQR